MRRRSEGIKPRQEPRPGRGRYGAQTRGLRGYGVNVTAVAGRTFARQGCGGLYDDVPNVEMFLDPWKVGGSLTFRHYAECRNEGLGEEWAFIRAHYDVVPNVEMRSRRPADVLGGWVR